MTARALLWLIPALPFAGALVLGCLGRRMPRALAGAIGAGSVGSAALVTALAGIDFIDHGSARHVTALWTWFAVDGLTVRVAFALDALALLMLVVITGIGFLIHLYSTEYMVHEIDDGGHAAADYPRFFAYMNLFVAAMCTLVLADDLLLLFLGWEGVGVCSYLLIGFWYRDPANGAAARKAFIVTRAGDTAFALGLFLLAAHLGTLEISAIGPAATTIWPDDSPWPSVAALLLLGGALGKSAQLPLQTWLPDAMAGPTPVSALIHAATMVTAGVYLVARMHPLYALAPAVLLLIGVIGAATLLLAALAALTQTDIKRVLACSTVSQIGYMFLALGAGVPIAAMFHFMTHAFFKALLFLAAGAVIVALHHEQDIRRMGGLRKALPGVFLVFLAGAAALAALPFVTSGFYSKDLVLLAAWTSTPFGPWLWGAGIAGAFLTAIYTFRLVILVFLGHQQAPVHTHPGWRMQVPLTILAIGALAAGFVETPATLGGVHLLSSFLADALPPDLPHVAPATEHLLSWIAIVATLAGIIAALMRYRSPPPMRDPAGVQAFLQRGWDFDRLYDALLVRPFVRLARVTRNDPADRVILTLATAATLLHRLLARTQTGRVRHYAGALAAGVVAMVGMVLFGWWTP